MGMRGEQSAAEAFGHLVAQTRWEDVAGQAHEAKRAILNFFATAIGSARDPLLESGLGVLAAFSGTRDASLIGRAEKLDVQGAAFVNAIAANFLDYDDTHLATVIHPAAPVAAPVLALAETRGGTGRDVLAAFILGVEIECRVGNAVSPHGAPGHYARGWHITSTCGVFGAAAAIARLCGLSAMQTTDALGVAASQSAGIVENLPSAAKNVSVGNAARNGIFAALLAQAGWGAAPTAIEGKLGWARAMGDEPDLIALMARLGETWEIAKNTYKPYPSGIVFHSVIDACLALRTRLPGGVPGGVDDVASVEVTGSALLLARGDRAVRNERDSRVSIHHAVACGLLLGSAGPREFTPVVVDDPAVVAMRAKVSARLDPAMPDGAALVHVTMRSGATLSETVLHARGSLQAPLTDADLEAKLREGVAQNGGRFDADALIDAVWTLDKARSVAHLMRLGRSA